MYHHLAYILLLYITASQVDNVAAESVLEEEAVDEAALEEQDRVALAAEDQNALNARNAVNQASQQQLQAIDQQQAAANQGGFLGWLWQNIESLAMKLLQVE